jgi:hypothetical protein
MSGLRYIDGLVSTGKKFPYTILKINFALRKNICNFFINILKWCVDKHRNKIKNLQATVEETLNFLLKFLIKILH